MNPNTTNDFIKISAAALFCILLAAFLVQMGVLFLQEPPTREPVKHNVLSVTTDHKDVVCFFRLDDNNQPQDMSCVYTGEPSWETETSMSNMPAVQW